MINIRNLELITTPPQNAILALGTFDGVHVAHRQIMQRTVELAKLNSGTAVVFTFSNHPLSVLRPGTMPPPSLSNQSDKELLIRKIGVDVLLSIEFTQEFASLSPIKFVKLLHEKFQPKYIIVGPNYSFGSMGKGNPALLQQKAASFGFHVEVFPPVEINNLMVSSTAIRKLIAHGNVETAAKLLGRYFQLTGTVVKGDGRGRILGFPTINLQPDSELLIPGRGVYAVKVRAGNTFYKGVCNVGLNPTFGGTAGFRVETHILNFSGDLYDKRMRLYFLGRLRDELTFSSVVALTTQIDEDIRCAKEKYFS